MGFLERLALGRTPPRRDWINLVGDDIAFERDIGDVRMWRFPDGDGVGVFFFNLEPDLPKSSDFPSFLARTRERVAACGATLVECNVVELDRLPATRQIIKVPQQPSGMTYLGAFTLPFARFSYVVKVQCEEHDVTGVREAVLLDEALKNNSVAINPGYSNQIAGDWDPDSEKFDDRFSTHPLSRLRRHLRYLESCVRVDIAVLKHRRFTLPQVGT